jgi:hypothetical protein
MIKIKKTGKYPLNKKTRVQRHAEPLKFQFFDYFFPETNKGSLHVPSVYPK